MSRLLRVGAAQVGPIYKEETRPEIVERLIALLEEAARRGVELICYPECSLSTFFPRMMMDWSEADKYFDKTMPNPSVQPLFDRAKELGIGFHLGYAELDGSRHYNTSILVDKNGNIVGKYRKSHIPGYSKPINDGRIFQNLERHYFLEGDTGFQTYSVFGGNIGLAVCNDRRWPETWRVLAMKGAELIIVGWNTSYYFSGRLTEFHNKLSIQSGCYQNGVWAVGISHCGEEEPGWIMMGQSMIVSPLGEIVAMSSTLHDELIDATIDLNVGLEKKLSFKKYRRPDLYKIITEQKGAIT
jgi:predicted amidohydrolase